MAHKTIRKENSLNDKFSETDAIIRGLAKAKCIAFCKMPETQSEYHIHITLHTVT
jgi:hypothetical protein